MHTGLTGQRRAANSLLRQVAEFGGLPGRPSRHPASP
jgi:hypothetical protein